MPLPKCECGGTKVISEACRTMSPCIHTWQCDRCGRCGRCYGGGKGTCEPFFEDIGQAMTYDTGRE